MSLSRVFILMGLSLICSPAFVMAEDLTLSDGTVYKSVTKITDAGDKVKVTYSDGLASVWKRDLPANYLSTHKVSPAASPMPAAPAATDAAAEESEDLELTAASVLGKEPYNVELVISHYEKGSFVCDGIIFQKKKELRKVITGTNSFTKQKEGEMRVVEVLEENQMKMRVYGLPKDLVGEKKWKGQLWLGGTRGKDDEMKRDAFTSKELAMQHIAKHGVGDIIDPEREVIKKGPDQNQYNQLDPKGFNPLLKQ